MLDLRLCRARSARRARGEGRLGLCSMLGDSLGTEMLMSVYDRYVSDEVIYLCGSVAVDALLFGFTTVGDGG